MNNSDQNIKEKERSWNHLAKPEKLPSPTYYPFFLAIGITFLCWGLLTHWIISIAGVIIIFITLKGWIKAMRHETGA
jgi:hypothetical protein